MKEIKEGSRKVVLTKWALTMFFAVTLFYLGILAYQSIAPPESLLMTFGGVVSIIFTAFSGSNAVEHWTTGKSKLGDAIKKGKELKDDI